MTHSHQVVLPVAVSLEEAPLATVKDRCVYLLFHAGGTVDSAPKFEETVCVKLFFCVLNMSNNIGKSHVCLHVFVDIPGLYPLKSLNHPFPLFSGTFAATPGFFCLSGGSRRSSSRSRSSIGDTPVTETNLPRNFGPHQGRVSVPPDPVPQVGVWECLQLLCTCVCCVLDFRSIVPLFYWISKISTSASQSDA